MYLQTGGMSVMKINKHTTIKYSIDDISANDLSVLEFALEIYEETIDINSKAYEELCEVQLAFNKMWSPK